MTADAVGGVWTYSLTLARGMASARIQCMLAVVGPSPSDAQRSEVADIPELHLRAHPFRLEWMDDPWPDVDAAENWLLELEREFQPAIIHLNGYAHAASEFRAPSVVVAHSCVCSWWRAVHGEAAPPDWDEYRRRVRAGLAAAELVIAPSASMLQDLEREHGSVGERGCVIENAAEIPAAGQNGQRDPVILAAGRFDDKSKNLALLAQAVPDTAWPVVAAGDGPRCAGIEMTGRLGHRALLDRMARAEIFCHPAVYEPFGLAPLEAALSGCALALADIASLREIWRDAAVFFDPRSAKSCAAALNRLAGDSELRSALASAALNRAHHFTPKRQISKYIAAYRSALALSGRQTAKPGAWLT